jgi:hypothetical protein
MLFPSLSASDGNRIIVTVPHLGNPPLGDRAFGNDHALSKGADLHDAPKSEVAALEREMGNPCFDPQAGRSLNENHILTHAASPHTGGESPPLMQVIISGNCPQSELTVIFSLTNGLCSAAYVGCEA